VIDLVVIDSIASLAPEAELKAIREEGFGKDTVGRSAAMLSKVFRAIAGCGCLRRTALLLVNQVRINIGSYGSPETSPGGKASLHYPKIILKLTKASDGLIKNKDEVLGHTVKVKVTKNNTGRGKPLAETEYKVLYGVGVDAIGPLLDAAVQLGVIQAGGAGSYSWDIGLGLQKERGKEKMEDLLRGDDSFRIEIERQVALRRNGPSERVELPAVVEMVEEPAAGEEELQ
jgi:recombination protein RecA